MIQIKYRSYKTGRVTGNYNWWTSAKAKIFFTMEDLPEFETDPEISVGTEQQTERPLDILAGRSSLTPRRLFTSPGDAEEHAAIRRETFEVPPHLSDDDYFIEQPPQGTRSLAHRLGVVLRPSVTSRDKRHFWQCLYGECMSMLVVAKTSTGNATKHLRTQHNIGSAKTEMVKQRREARKKRAVSGARLYTADPQRYYNLKITSMIVDASLPISFCKNGHLRDLVMVSGGKHLQLHPALVRHCAVEIYSNVKDKIKQEFASVIQTMNCPTFHLGVDIYTNEIQLVKYLGLRVSFTNMEAHTRASNSLFKPYMSYNLAIREFNPTPDDLQTTRLSDLLAIWTRRVLQEYGLSQTDIVTSTSDAGSDVRRLLETCLRIPREWCAAHLVNCAMVETFKKIVKAKTLIDDMKRVVKFTKKSPNAITSLRSLQKEAGYRNKPVAFAYQRWASSSRMFQFFQLNLDLLREYFGDPRKRPFKWPASIDELVIEELNSLLKQVHNTLRSLQGDMTFGGTHWLELVKLYYGLNPGKKLAILKDNLNDQKEFRDFYQLDELTRRVISRLRAELNKRYFDRFHPVLALKSAHRKAFERSGRNFTMSSSRFRFSYLFEMLLFFSPRYRNGAIIKKVIEARMLDADADTQIVGVRKENMAEFHSETISKLVRQRIIDFARKNLSDHLKTSSAIQQQTPSYETASLDNASELEKDLLEGVLSDNEATPRKKKVSITSKLNEEITSYLATSSASLLEGLDIGSERAVYEFWRRELDGRSFPYLARVALAFLSMKLTSAAIERDFSPVSDIITRKRSQLSPKLVEILAVLKLNKDLIPSDVGKIQAMTKETVEDLLNPTNAWETDRLGDEIEHEAKDTYSGDLRSDSDSENTAINSTASDLGRNQRYTRVRSTSFDNLQRDIDIGTRSTRHPLEAESTDPEAAQEEDAVELNLLSSRQERSTRIRSLAPPPDTQQEAKRPNKKRRSTRSKRKTRQK